MVQHPNKELVSRSRSSSSHLSQTYHLSVRYAAAEAPTPLEEIVSQVIGELSDVAQRNPIASVVLYGARRRQVQSLMSKHPHMPSAVTVQTLPGEGERPVDKNDRSNEVPFTVYRIDTDCYPFSSRFR